MPVKEALAELRALKPGESFSYRALAKKYGCCRSTLTRQHKQEVASHEDKALSQRLIHPRDEEELVQYIARLTERHLMPTRQMIRNFATPLAGKEPSDTWVSDLLRRHTDRLLTAWTTPMEAGRHQADSYEKYRCYFDLVHSKMAQYELLPENTYNMDEKGFAIGVTGRSKRIFDKVLYGKKQFKQSLHDGNREWVTLLACICADGTALPPGIIYSAAGRAVQQSWVAPITPKEHSVHFTTSPNGWTNNDLGLTWLEQVFNRYSKPKARRRWRLLIIDGHGSHVTKDFITYCNNNKILLLIFPPHATHTLQPLDVVCFKPLSQNYTKGLDQRIQKTQGWVPVKKTDFFPLFWDAWVKTFTKELVLKAFEATGLFPQNADKILHRFKQATPRRLTTPPQQTALSTESGEPPWLKAKSLLRSVVVDNNSEAIGSLEQYIHHLSVQNQLLQHQLDGCKEAVLERKRMQGKQRVLPLYAHNLNWKGGAKWWSPSSKKEADARQDAFDAYEAEQEAAKATKRELKKTQKLLKQKQDEQKAVRQEREKKERDERKAAERKAIDERKAERQRLKEARDAQKAVQLSQKGKRTASQSAAPRKKQNRGAAGVRSGGVAHELPSEPPATHSNRGRKIVPPQRFW